MKKERKFLHENFYPTNSNKGFLLEFEGGENYKKKAIENPDLPIYLVGIIQKGDAPNRNGRIYPFNILKKECERYMNEEVKDGQSYGELDHPAESSTPELKFASHTIEDIWYKTTEVWAKIKILNAFMPENATGKIARGIVLNGKTLGISSRALGSVYSDSTGYDIVDDDLELICWDLVSRPSTHDANLSLKEGVKKNTTTNYLTEKKCFGNECNIKTSRKLIKENKLKNLSSEEKIYLNCLGVEKFLRLKYGK